MAMTRVMFRMTAMVLPIKRNRVGSIFWEESPFCTKLTAKLISHRPIM